MSDEEWALVAPCLALLRENSGQRDHELREVFNGLRYITKTGAPWRFMPHDLPPWAAVYRQTQRWLAADCFSEVAGDLRAVLQEAAGRESEPSAVILDSRTQRSLPESGERAGYDGAKRRRGSRVHLAVDTPGHVPGELIPGGGAGITLLGSGFDGWLTALPEGAAAGGARMAGRRAHTVVVAPAGRGLRRVWVAVFTL